VAVAPLHVLSFQGGAGTRLWTCTSKMNSSPDTVPSARATSSMASGLTS
jgi:hypothetical protein